MLLHDPFSWVNYVLTIMKVYLSVPLLYAFA